MRIIKTCLTALAALSLAAHAVTVKDEKGDFTLDKTPERIVALEFSFVDALANAGVAPVGVADDNDAKRLLPQIREQIGEYTSVGTRSQPNMETIASLKPDLIIADKDRHTAAYDELGKIAPVLLLNSRHGTYADILVQAQTIGEVVGKGDKMKAKIDALDKEIAEIKANLPQGQKAFVGSSREDGFDIHSKQSYSGALLEHLGFDVPDAPGNKPIYDAGLEQVLAIDPDWIFVAHYREESMVKKWEKEALWPALKAAKAGQVVSIDPNLWSRARGLYAARAMAEQIRDAAAQK
ncbi:MAG: Fe(3+) dicitrate ABC transporter substrate-binding protein [Cardiobacteriaceae bacterium]|nr:Fe(3+) dicitrate ABC transporter substrate-binding protein [Cardiobacteriaceae bacterium]